MRLLAIETSTTACSVALEVDGETNDRHEVEPRAHTGILMPMISGLLEDAGLGAADLDAVVLGNGPGSFIGMRIGASVAQGICHGAGLEIVPVSSLAAIAAEVMHQDNDVAEVVVAQDARMGEVYVGHYRRGDDGLPALAGGEEIVQVGAMAAGAVPIVAAGDAWHSIPALAEANAKQLAAIADVRLPRARYLLPLGNRDLRAGRAVAPQQLKPAYLRTRVAKAPAGA